MNTGFWLLLLFAAATLCIITVAGWALVPAASRHQSRLWFSGIAVYAVAMITLAVHAAIPPLAFAAGTLAMPLLSVLLLTDCLRRNMDRPPWSILGLVILAFLHLGAMLALNAGAGEDITRVTHLSVMTAIELYMLGLLVKLGRRHASRGLLVCGLGIATLCAINLVRVGEWALGYGLTPLSHLTTGSATLIIMLSLAVTAVSIGYWGFLLERSHEERTLATEAAARANEAQRVSEDFSARLQELVQQRDHMIMTLSRFSTLGNLAVLNAGIVHEMSQPLQVLLSHLESLQMEMQSGRTGTITQQLDMARAMALEATQLLQALRRLAHASPAAVSEVPVAILIERILPIIESESRQRGVSFQSRQSPVVGVEHVRADPVMLERIILNLVSNALEALATSEGSRTDKCLELARQLEHRADGSLLVITVTDNGPGIPGTTDATPTPLPASTKPQGMGIGLLWVQVLIEQWGGKFQLENRPAPQGRGAIATIRLPLRQPA